MKLSEFFGNKPMIDALGKSIANGRVFHAYIFSGAAGGGKYTLAQAFAATIICHNPANNDACGICQSCISLAAGTHPDIVRLIPQKSSIGVEEIRDMIRDAAIKPYYSRRVYIIRNVDIMTVPAQNALLKTLEDSAAHGVFILTAKNPAAFLPTILSRCAIYKLAPLPQSDIAAYLAAREIPRAQNLAAIAPSIGAALSFANDEGFWPHHDHIAQIAANISKMNIAEIFAAAKEIESAKDRLPQTLDILTLHLHKILMQTPASQQSIAPLSAINQARVHLSANTNPLLTIEIMLLDIAQKSIT